MGYLRGYLRGYLMGLQVHFMCFCCSYIHQIWSSLGTFRCSVEISRGKDYPKKAFCSCGHLRERTRTFEGKDENVWGKVGSRLRERNSTSYCLLKSLHMAREPSVGSCFRHFQSPNGHLITQFLPSLHRIEKFCFAQMSPKTGKSIGIGGENMKFEAFEHSNLMHLVPFSSVEAMESCLRQYYNSL